MRDEKSRQAGRLVAMPTDDNGQRDSPTLVLWRAGPMGKFREWCLGAESASRRPVIAVCWSRSE
jgi:hypothetical protein